MQNITCGIIGYKNIPADKQDKVWRELLREIDTALDDGGCRKFVTEHTRGIGSQIAFHLESLHTMYPEISWEAVLPAPNKVIPFDRDKMANLTQYYTTKRIDVKQLKNYPLGATRYIVGKASRIIAVCDRDNDHDTAYAMDYTKSMGLVLQTIYF